MFLMFLKKHLPASGLTFFPKSGHVLNLEEPALFNETVERFLALVEANRRGARDPRSALASPHCEERQRRSSQFFLRQNGLLHGTCHRGTRRINEKPDHQAW